MSRNVLQGRVTTQEYERVRHHARRRGISIAEWVREQAVFGIQADDEAEATGDRQENEPEASAAQPPPEASRK